MSEAKVVSETEAQDELNYLLSRIPLLAAFSPETALELASHITERKVEAGQLIFCKGDPGKELLIVRRGSIKIFLPETDSCEEAVLAILRDGEFFGELSLLDGQARSASAVAMSETILLCLQHETFYQALQSDFHAVRHVIAVLCERLRITDVRLAEAAFRDVRERLAKYLWQLAEQESVPTQEGLRLKTAITDTELAKCVGATVERVRAELHRLARELIITWHGAELTVLKPHDLRDMAHAGSAPSSITVPDWLLG